MIVTFPNRQTMFSEHYVFNMDLIPNTYPNDQVFRRLIWGARSIPIVWQPSVTSQTNRNKIPKAYIINYIRAIMKLLLRCKTIAEQWQSLIRNEKLVHQRHSGQNQYQSDMTNSSCWHQRQWDLHWGSPSPRRQVEIFTCIGNSSLTFLCDSVHFHHSQVFGKTRNRKSLKLDFPNTILGCKILYWCCFQLLVHGGPE